MIQVGPEGRSSHSGPRRVREAEIGRVTREGTLPFTLARTTLLRPKKWTTCVLATARAVAGKAVVHAAVRRDWGWLQRLLPYSIPTGSVGRSRAGQSLPDRRSEHSLENPRKQCNSRLHPAINEYSAAPSRAPRRDRALAEVRKSLYRGGSFATDRSRPSRRGPALARVRRAGRSGVALASRMNAAG